MRNITILLSLFVLGCSNTNRNNSYQETDTVKTEQISSQNWGTIKLEKLPEIGDRLSDFIMQTSNSLAKIVTSVKSNLK
jgi:hypothetical protein